jgi:hypothetical protein
VDFSGSFAPAIVYPARTRLMDTEWLLKPPLKGVVVIDQPAGAMTITEAFCLTVATRCFYCFA